MKESDLESILAKHPDLIEDGLILVGQQITVYGRRMDLLFEDRFKRKLIVELKAGPIKDEHIGQILAYEGMLLSADNPDIRVMLIGTRVPPNIQRYLDHHGIAWKEIKSTYLKDSLAKKGDNQFDNLFEDEISSSVKITKNETKNSASIDCTKGGIIKYTEEFHLERCSPIMRDAYYQLKNTLLSFNIDVRSEQESIRVDYAKSNIAEILFRYKKEILKFYINLWHFRPLNIDEILKYHKPTYNKSGPWDVFDICDTNHWDEIEKLIARLVEKHQKA